MSDKNNLINIKGYVTIYQEDDDKNRTYICNHQPNTLMATTLKGLASFFAGYYITNTNSWAYDQYILTGSDTVTTSTHDLTALVTPHGVSPDTKFGNNITNDGNGTYKFAFISSWIKGRISGTLGEIGLYLRPYTVFTAKWNTTHNPSPVLCSRLCAADSDFASFTVDDTKSLTIIWEWVINYV